MRNWAVLLASLVLVSAGLVAPASAKFDAGLVNVSFGNKDVVPDGKAVLGADGDKWNTPDGNKGDKVELTDAKAAKTDLTVTFDAAGVYDADDAGAVGTPNEKLLRKYLYSSDPQKVTLTGLTPGAKYDLVVYSASNADNRKTKFTVGADSQTTTFSMDQKALADGVNYAKFTAAADADGKLVVTYEGVDGGEGNLNGMQVAPAAASAPAPAPAK